MGPIDQAQFKALLLTRRDELQALAQVRAEQSAVVELDQTTTGRLSRMDALQGQAMAQATSARAEQELRAIDVALIRVEQGEYGECLECGESIAVGRLRANLVATLCIACAAERE